MVFGGNPSEMQAARSTELPDEGARRLWDQEAGRLGQPAAAGQPESRRLQGRAAADRHLSGGSPRGSTAPRCRRHYPSPLNEKKIWDLVNFVLALPYEPELLTDALPPPRPGDRLEPPAGEPRIEGTGS